MAISLSNHEDRIKKLEARGPKYMNLLGVPRNSNGLPNGIANGRTYKLRDSVTKYDLLIFTFAQDDNKLDGIFVNRLFTSCVMFASDFCNGISAECGSTETYARIAYVDESTVKCWGAYSQGVPMVDKQFLTVAALKLYYNFSYNIYRLVNYILFHFFKCLINSFKGGVKEIWQLV